MNADANLSSPGAPPENVPCLWRGDWENPAHPTGAPAIRTAPATILAFVWAGATLAASTEPAARPGRLPPGITPVHYEISVEPDAQGLKFHGRETIDIDVATATDTVVLNAADLRITRAQLDQAQQATVTLDADAQTAALRFPKPLAPGRHQLALEYSGRIYMHATGLFALDYSARSGPQRMLTTQFEVGDARRFAPLWDEPAAKATFALEVVIPKEQSAYSNMPQVSMRTEGAQQRIRFDTSPRMSSYLLHLTVGDLERISSRVAGVDIGVVTRKGASESGRFALDAAAEILPWYNQYFGTPYPLPKLDMIAVPGSSQFFGAMENWGAIMYFEPALLLDPRLSSESDRQNVFGAVAHEMAHQWFGNLVTMDWWDDLWLNEGYATWMAAKVEEALHPRWNTRLQVVNGSREDALRTDADAATHPVVQPVPSVAAANQVFDAIAYQKGSAVIRMLEEGLGEAGFRDGIRRYMRKYAYGNTVTDQLWAELAAATGQPVSGIAHDFTLQPGVPLVTVASGPCESGRTGIALSQSRFETGPKSLQPTAWQIPVRVQSTDGGARANVLLGRDGMPATVDIAGCGPVVVNAGQSGYFRTQYATTDLARLRENFTRIAEVDRLGLLSDTLALGEAGRIPAASYLELAAAVPDDSDPLILRQVAGTFAQIDQLFDGSSQQAAWRSFARGKLRPVFDHVGWLPAAGEPETVALLRETLLRSLGRMADPAVIAAARDRFARAPQEPGALPVAILRPVLEVVARHADAATWSEILARATTAREPIEQQRLFSALGLALDPALSMRALELSLSAVPPAAFVTNIIDAVSFDHPAQAFDFAVQREHALMAHVDAASQWSVIPYLAYWSDDAGMAGKVRSYMERSVPADARHAAETVIARIDYRAEVKARQLPELEAWIRAAAR